MVGGDTWATRCHEVWFVMPGVCRNWLETPAPWHLGAWAQEVAKKPPVPGEAEPGEDVPCLWKRGTQVPGGSMSKQHRVTPGLADCHVPVW